MRMLKNKTTRSHAMHAYTYNMYKHYKTRNDEITLNDILKSLSDETGYK